MDNHTATCGVFVAVKWTLAAGKNEETVPNGTNLGDADPGKGPACGRDAG